MKVQLDENLPPALARALNALVAVDDYEVVHAGDYARGAPDIELFRRAIESGVRVHITADHHHRRPAEREEIAKLGLTVFVLASGWDTMGHYEKAARLIEYWPKIMTMVEIVAPGSIFRVPHGRNRPLEPIKRR
ncbi:hypothetical protein [Lysobacter sp. GCM10012299]|uniref:PIN-like domain-containing protein n=1 Tax=Lysobacter sp. GCM10012299 TaxID=3317333 RepID=UPI003605DEFB